MQHVQVLGMMKEIDENMWAYMASLECIKEFSYLVDLNHAKTRQVLV